MHRDSDWQIYDDAGRRKYLTQSERLRFLEAADTMDARIRALCYVLTLTGCRVSEALSLKRHHLDEDRHSIVFRTLKQRKIRFRSVPIPEMLTKMLVGLGVNGDVPFWTIHRVTAWRNVKTVMMKAQITSIMATCKGLRHGFGIHAATTSVPVNIIARWMGHASQLTTAIYLNATGPEERLFALRMWKPQSERLAA